MSAESLARKLLVLIAHDRASVDGIAYVDEVFSAYNGQKQTYEVLSSSD
jgi:hypothetical protein